MIDQSTETAAVILAGGLSRRMGHKEKALLPFGTSTLIGHVVARAQSQVTDLVISANGDPGRFADLDLPVVPDPVEGFAGPLAGILAGLDWGHEASKCRWMVSLPSDTPFFPEDLVARLETAAKSEGTDFACARSQGRMHPVVGLWPVSLREALRDALVNQGIRKIDEWTAHFSVAVVDFETDPVDPFFNANRPDDLEMARRTLKTLSP